MLDVIEPEKTLLIIEPSNEKRHLLTTFFSRSYQCDETESVDAAVEKIAAREYSVILGAILPPNFNSLELIPHIQQLELRSVPVFMSEGKAAGNTVRAFRAGAFEVIQMPISLRKLESAVEKAFGQFEMKCLKDRYQNHLEDLVAERTAELDKALEDIEDSYRMTLKALVQALATRDSDTHGHSERVVTFSLRIGHELGLDKMAMRDLELGSLLHDIGKIGVPDAILRKPAKLNAREWSKMKLHPEHGQKILENIPFLEGAARIVAQHHEMWDGSGYPFGLRGEDIDIGARVFSVADAFDAMISDRVYRKGRPYADALAELEKYCGTQFDPVVIDAFKTIPAEDWEILRERSLAVKQENLSLQAIVAELVYPERRFELVH
jgi:response regulator RpfG family c-di-GMP phosphodiesterase